MNKIRVKKIKPIYFWVEIDLPQHIFVDARELVCEATCIIESIPCLCKNECKIFIA